MAIAIVPTITKPDHLNSGRFCLDFKWFLTKLRPFVRISNGWASGFQMPFKIQNICNPTSFGPFKIQTRSDSRSPLKMLDQGSPTWGLLKRLIMAQIRERIAAYMKRKMIIFKSGWILSIWLSKNFHHLNKRHAPYLHDSFDVPQMFCFFVK